MDKYFVKFVSIINDSNSKGSFGETKEDRR
jgi:hypothetical protein